jgi:hypothetical protein
MVAGFIGLGTAAERLSRRGIPPMAVAGAGMAVFLLLLLLLCFPSPPWPRLLWIGFGFFGTSGILPYAVLSQRFPPELSGRVNTALNLLVFVAAFGAQWGIGAVIGHWPVATQGGYATEGYRAAFAAAILFQAASIAWFWLAGIRSGGRGKRRGPAPRRR